MTKNGLASKPPATFAEDRKKPAIRVSYWEDEGEAFVKEKFKQFGEATMRLEARSW